MNHVNKRQIVFICCWALKICDKNNLMLFLPVIVISRFRSKFTWSALRLGGNDLTPIWTKRSDAECSEPVSRPLCFSLISIFFLQLPWTLPTTCQSTSATSLCASCLSSIWSFTAAWSCCLRTSGLSCCWSTLDPSTSSTVIQRCCCFWYPLKHVLELIQSRPLLALVIDTRVTPIASQWNTKPEQQFICH